MPSSLRISAFLCAFLGGRRKTPYFSTFLKAPFRYLFVEDKQGSAAVNVLGNLFTAEAQRNAEIRREKFANEVSIMFTRILLLILALTLATTITA